MKFNLYNKYRVKTLQRGLERTEEKIQTLSDNLSTGTTERKIIEKELLKEYNAYTHYAYEYMQRQIPKVKDPTFVEHRLCYKAWQLVVGLLDKVYIKHQPSADRRHQ